MTAKNIKEETFHCFDCWIFKNFREWIKQLISPSELMSLSSSGHVSASSPSSGVQGQYFSTKRNENNRINAENDTNFSIFLEKKTLTGKTVVLFFIDPDLNASLSRHRGSVIRQFVESDPVYGSCECFNRELPRYGRRKRKGWKKTHGSLRAPDERQASPGPCYISLSTRRRPAPLPLFVVWVL